MNDIVGYVVIVKSVYYCSKEDKPVFDEMTESFIVPNIESADRIIKAMNAAEGSSFEKIIVGANFRGYMKTDELWKGYLSSLSRYDAKNIDFGAMEISLEGQLDTMTFHGME